MLLSLVALLLLTIRKVPWTNYTVSLNLAKSICSLSAFTLTYSTLKCLRLYNCLSWMSSTSVITLTVYQCRLIVLLADSVEMTRETYLVGHFGQSQWFLEGVHFVIFHCLKYHRPSAITDGGFHITKVIMSRQLLSQLTRQWSFSKKDPASSSICQ